MKVVDAAYAALTGKKLRVTHVAAARASAVRLEGADVMRFFFEEATHRTARPLEPAPVRGTTDGTRTGTGLVVVTNMTRSAVRFRGDAVGRTEWVGGGEMLQRQQQSRRFASNPVFAPFWREFEGDSVNAISVAKHTHARVL